MTQLETGRIIANCIECGNNAEVWEDDPKPLCEYCQHFEMCEPPEKIIFGEALWTGERRAYCKNCDIVFAYWECSCDLEHDCKKH